MELGERQVAWQAGDMPATLEPSELCPALHAQVDQLEVEALAILHRVALQLELDQLVVATDSEFDALRQDGRFNRLPEMIREAREAIRARAML